MVRSWRNVGFPCALCFTTAAGRGIELDQHDDCSFGFRGSRPGSDQSFLSAGALLMSRRDALNHRTNDHEVFVLGCKGKQCNHCERQDSFRHIGQRLEWDHPALNLFHPIARLLGFTHFSNVSLFNRSGVQ